MCTCVMIFFNTDCVYINNIYISIYIHILLYSVHNCTYILYKDIHTYQKNPQLGIHIEIPHRLRNCPWPRHRIPFFHVRGDGMMKHIQRRPDGGSEQMGHRIG